jgi:hypothetical protein
MALSGEISLLHPSVQLCSLSESREPPAREAHDGEGGQAENMCGAAISFA